LSEYIIPPDKLLRIKVFRLTALTDTEDVICILTS
jgi:hypothetical protein